jgi:plastocyanin
MKQSARAVRLALCASVLGFAPNAMAQSLLDRSPNMSGDWVGASGSLYFHFIHRFSTTGAPERKVTNVPTFLFGAGLTAHFFAGFNYSTNSTLAPRFPNEWEGFVRWAPLSQDLGAPVDLGGQVGYNNAAQGVDGEVSVARTFGVVRLIAGGRALSDPLKSGHERFAAAGGGTIRLGNYVALAGDVASLTSRDSAERVAWSAGLHFAIPMTPHTLSLQVTNTLVGTLQGNSRGTKGRRYGFEFTIPLTLNRYFGKREQQVDSAEAPPSVAVAPIDSVAKSGSAEAGKVTIPIQPASTTPTAPAATLAVPAPAKTASKPVSVPSTADAPRAAAKTVRNGMKNINYLQGRLQITVGTTVEWTNTDPLAHSVTAVDKSFNSGLIQPGKKFRHTFTKAGTYNYFCMPHPFMKGVVVVKESS